MCFNGINKTWFFSNVTILKGIYTFFIHSVFFQYLVEQFRNAFLKLVYLCQKVHYHLLWKDILRYILVYSRWKEASFKQLLPVLLYGCSAWILTSKLERKLDGAYTCMLWVSLGEIVWPLSDCMVTFIQYQTLSKSVVRSAEYCWRAKNEIVSEVLLGESTQWRASQDLYQANFWHPKLQSLSDLQNMMNNRIGWWQRIMEICASCDDES